jgi:hypothetical protein
MVLDLRPIVVGQLPYGGVLEQTTSVTVDQGGDPRVSPQGSRYPQRHKGPISARSEPGAVSRRMGSKEAHRRPDPPHDVDTHDGTTWS